jgi:hypothetical protein
LCSGRFDCRGGAGCDDCAGVLMVGLCGLGGLCGRAPSDGGGGWPKWGVSDVRPPLWGVLGGPVGGCAGVPLVWGWWLANVGGVGVWGVWRGPVGGYGSWWWGCEGCVGGEGCRGCTGGVVRVVGVGRGACVCSPCGGPATNSEEGVKIFVFGLRWSCGLVGW